MTARLGLAREIIVIARWLNSLANCIFLVFFVLILMIIIRFGGFSEKKNFIFTLVCIDLRTITLKKLNFIYLHYC
jgi:hypothetical protein